PYLRDHRPDHSIQIIQTIFPAIMKHTAPYKIFIILLTVVLVAGSLLWVNYTINRQAVKKVVNVSNTEFNREHFNYIITDTFINLLQTAYGAVITVTTEQNRLKVTLSNSGAMTRDFFNGNDKVLAHGLDDFGFKIDYSKYENKIDAIFVI